MKQLTGLDASFLYLETANSPMHISGLGIYDPATAPGGKVRFKDIIENINHRALGLPVMTQTLLTVPFGLDHPYWVTDGSFDPEFHIRHIALPKPGDWRQLCIQVARLHARPLDRKRPLWEIYVIEGLDNVAGVPSGSFAMFSKTHHAAIDGTSGMEMTAAIHDLSPNYQTQPPSLLKIDRHPSLFELLLRSSANTLTTPFHLISVARNTVPGFARAAAGLSRGRLSRVKNIPRTRFNGTVSPHRVFDAINVPLEDIKAIKNSVSGATVNDAAITIVGGALRKYLSAHDELPEFSLAAMAPINVRSDKDKTGGNLVAAMTVLMRTDIDAPLERLQAVYTASQNAKELTNAVGAKVMTDYSRFIPSTLTAQAARLASRWGLVNRMSPAFNCVITNVPGPPIPLYNTGAKMVANYGTGPAADGLGLFHVISSYCGQFVISATSCRKMMPDPEFYRQCLQESFDELLAATVTGKTAAAAKPKRRAGARAKAGSRAKAKANTRVGPKATAGSRTKTGTKPGVRRKANRAATP